MVAIFFAPPNVLSGLFTLANFDEPLPNGVIAHFGAGCASIVDYPYKELQFSEYDLLINYPEIRWFSGGTEIKW